MLTCWLARRRVVMHTYARSKHHELELPLEQRDDGLAATEKYAAMSSARGLTRYFLIPTFPPWNSSALAGPPREPSICAPGHAKGPGSRTNLATSPSALPAHPKPRGKAWALPGEALAIPSGLQRGSGAGTRSKIRGSAEFNLFPGTS